MTKPVGKCMLIYYNILDKVGKLDLEQQLFISKIMILGTFSGKVGGEALGKGSNAKTESHLH